LPDAALRRVPYISAMQMQRPPSPKWVIDCRNCLGSFVHSEIGNDRRLIDYLLPTAPEFPANGAEMECPLCKTKATYTRQDLRYQP